MEAPFAWVTESETHLDPDTGEGGGWKVWSVWRSTPRWSPAGGGVGVPVKTPALKLNTYKSEKRKLVTKQVFKQVIQAWMRR